MYFSDDSNLSQLSRTTKNGQKEEQIETLTCVPVNFTYYDELIGIAQRFSHPITPEPEVIVHRITEKHTPIYPFLLFRLRICL